MVCNREKLEEHGLYERTRNEPKTRVLFDKMFQLFQKAYTEAFLNFGAYERYKSMKEACNSVTPLPYVRPP